MAKRLVTMTPESGFIWELVSAECPLLPLTQELGERAKSCVSGMSTNMQGFIPLNFCKHCDQESLVDEGDKLFLECTR